MDVPSSASPSLPRKTSVNPFLADVCATPFEVVETQSVGTLNRDVMDGIANAVEDLSATPQRPLLLLTAPRAGYGKTHLLGRVAAASQSQSVAIPIMFRSDTEVTWSAASHEAMDALRLLPGRYPGWSRLREVCTGVFANLVIRLIRDGRLPCANREQAIRVLQNDPTELFREDTQARLIGEWLRKHYGQLRKPLAEAAAQVPGAGVMDGWVDALFSHANHGTTASAETMMQLAGGSREAFLLWLRIVAQWRPVVVFVDHIDGFYRMEKAGLRIAMMLLEITSAEGVHVVLSVNQDVWQATFAHHLPSAIEDRLTASQFLLRGLSADDAAQMIRLRMSHGAIAADEATKFERFLNIPRYFQGRPVGSVSARAFLRHAAQQWQAYEEMRARGEEPADSPLLEDEPLNVPSPQSDPLPDVPSDAPQTIFPMVDAAFMKLTAASLAEPEHAMVNTPFNVAAQAITPAQPPSIIEPSSPFAIAPPPQGMPGVNGNGAVAPASQAQPNGPGALERLREMMDRLRSQGATPPAPVAPTTPMTSVAERLSTVMDSGDSLVGRFNALRVEMLAEASQQPLDLTRLTDLIRLAGKRFPLVKYDELELQGLGAKTLPRWSLSTQEILFGMFDFNDRTAWKAVAQQVGDRLRSLASAGGNAPQQQLKLLAIKSDRESSAWSTLLSSDALPAELRPHVEALHLDNRSVAALYAMQRMIDEASSGKLSATPAQVMTVLARELDFFWKRVTRPLAVA